MQAEYLISEPINGRTLREVLDSGPIPPGAGGPFVPQIEEALRAAHDKGVAHGDLTPDAILFSRERVHPVSDESTGCRHRRECGLVGPLMALRTMTADGGSRPLAENRL